ncbi:glycosyltransferase family 39 protein [Pelagibius sp. Alg239-R121]|uniref:ArnT family glycosyltransferase n=1 Tax=Pelagibius sp. Alg239-R121 TaxID=2993448 RepID=UPI0024A61AAF|nr:glycosyltransferase family 39 protein [Pelagibius sp. Alg239-R121]
MTFSAIADSPRKVVGLSLVAFLLLVAYAWVGYLGSDDVTYADGAYGWIESFPYVGGHGTVRYTITVPMALSFLALGESEFAMTLPTLIYGMGLIALIVLMLHRALGALPASLGAVLLVTSPLLVTWATIASVDIIEAFFIFASLFCFYESARREVSWPFLLAAGALAGLGFLTRETTVFFLVFYGVAFLTGYGIRRLQHFVMAAGFFAVWLAEVVYFFIMTGDPLYRINISLNHDSTIDRSIDVAGNVIAHPIIDPLLVLLANQEFAVLFWVVLPAGLWLLLSKSVSPAVRQSAVFFGSVGLIWLLCVGAVQSLLPLNPRYFLISAICASVLTALAIAESFRLRRHFWAAAVLLLVLAGNFAGIYVENRNHMFGERALTAAAARYGEALYTDPLTHRRAELLLKWSDDGKSVLKAPPPPGSLYLYNEPRAQSLDNWVSEEVIGSYQPQESWELLETVTPSSKLAGTILRMIGVEDFLPYKLKNALSEGHPGIKLYRLPDTAASG